MERKDLSDGEKEYQESEEKVKGSTTTSRSWKMPKKLADPEGSFMDGYRQK